MVDFDKFEKNVKNNYGNQEFPFDEQNWEKAAKLIDASRQGKNRGGIFLLSAVALLCTTGLVYYFGFSDSNKALQKNNLASNQVVTANETVVANKEIAQVNETSTINNDAKVNSNSNATENNSNETAIVNEVAKTNSSTVKSNSKNTTGVITNEKNVAENKASNLTNETKAEEKTANSNPTSESTPNNTQNSKSEKSTQKSGSKNTIPTVLGATIAQNTTKPSNTTNTTNNENANTNKIGIITNTSVAEPTEEKTATVTDSTNAIVSASIKPTESVVVDSVPAIRKSRADSLAAMMPKGDGVSYATNVKEKHNAKNILFMEAGTTYLLGWNGGGKNEADGFNLLAGVNFQHYFTGSIAAQIGVQYSTIGNLTHTSHTISTVKYDLGVEQDVTSIKYQTLHYLVAPIKLTFNAGDKNIIGIGANVAYLLNSNSKKEKYKTYSSDPNATKNNLTSTKESGYVQGFNPYDIQISASYRRKLYKGLSAQAEFFYGLTDTKNNSFFKSNVFDRNVGFKISLCYDLFKK